MEICSAHSGHGRISVFTRCAEMTVEEKMITEVSGAPHFVRLLPLRSKQKVHTVA